MATKWQDKKTKIWYIRYKDNHNKWKLKHVGRGRKASEVEVLRKKYDSLEFNRANDLNTPIKGLGIESIFDEFKKLSLLDPALTEGTHISYKKKVRNISNWFEHYNIKKMDEITSAFVNTFNEYFLIQREHTKGTARECQKIFIRFLNWSIQNNYFNNYQIVLGIKKISKPKKSRPHFFSEENLSKIFNDSVYSDAYQFLFYTGLRVSELCNLKRKHILRDSNELVIVSPKSGAEIETIPINTKAWRVINRLQSESESLFLNTKGNPVTQQALWKELKKVLSRNNIEEGTIHTFRHSFASHLALKGVSIHKLKELLRHSDIKTTMIYSHLTEKAISEASEEIPDIEEKNED